MVWGRTPDGESVPLDPSAPVYKVDAMGAAVRAEPGFYLVSHFATCRDRRAVLRGQPGQVMAAWRHPVDLHPEVLFAALLTFARFVRLHGRGRGRRRRGEVGALHQIWAIAAEWADPI